jgi:transcriptional regulator with XRE-family HTH domain
MRTGMVESLTGFTSRLSAAHDVTLATLFGWEIAPLLDKEHLRRSESRSNKSAVLATSFRPMERAVNGTGVTARSFAEALEKLTMRGGLSYLTMLTWKEVISHRHLIRPTRAWCPACYEEWRLTASIIYEPLLWSLEAISSCPSHRRRLRERCHLCQHSLHLLASHSRPGYCSVCKGWLGKTQFTPLSQEEALDENELEWQSSAVEQVGELLSAAPALLDHPQKAVIAESITRCIEVSPFKNELELARNLEIPQPTLNDWRMGNHVPQLDKILRVCLITGVSLLDFIFGRLPEGNTPPLLLSNEAVKQNIRPRPRLPRRWTEAENKRARATLEAALVEDPPPPMIEVACRVDRSTSTLQLRFTELCRKVINPSCQLLNERSINLISKQE